MWRIGAWFILLVVKISGSGGSGCSSKLKGGERERKKERPTYLPTYLQFDRWIFHTVLAGLMCSYKSINMFTAYVGRLQVAIETGALGDLLPLQRCTADQLR